MTNQLNVIYILTCSSEIYPISVNNCIVKRHIVKFFLNLVTGIQKTNKPKDAKNE